MDRIVQSLRARADAIDGMADSCEVTGSGIKWVRYGEQGSVGIEYRNLRWLAAEFRALANECESNGSD